MSHTPLKAYKVWCEDDDHGAEVEFARRGKDISKYTNSEHCDCHLLERRVTRAPEFDKYSPGPVTIREKLAEGWHTDCHGCFQRVWGEDDPVIILGYVYHSGACVQAALASHEKWHEGKDPLSFHVSVRHHIASIRQWLKKHPEQIKSALAAATGSDERGA